MASDEQIRNEAKDFALGLVALIDAFGDVSPNDAAIALGLEKDGLASFMAVFEDIVSKGEVSLHEAMLRSLQAGLLLGRASYALRRE